VVTLSWTSDEPGTSFAEFGLDGALDMASPQTESAGTEHSALLLGMKAGRSYSFRAVTITESGQRLEGAVGTVEIDDPPADLARFTVSSHDEAQAQPGGYIMTSLLGVDNGWVVILDRDADYVWYHKADGGLSITTTQPGLDGASILHSQYDASQEIDVAGTVRIAVDGSYETLTSTVLGHHDFDELPDGTIAWISIDMGTAVIEDKEYSIAGDCILEGIEGSDDPEAAAQVFSYMDDYHDPWPSCDHFWALAYETGGWDWVHANSLMYDEDDDAYHIMAKNLDHILKVDRATGEVLWEIGGAHSTFELTSGTPWSHGHMSQIWDDGFMVFDNAYHADPTVSRVVEYAYDEGAQTYEQVWEHLDPGGNFIQLLGDVRKLPNGNYLNSWTSLGKLDEVTADEVVVWQAEAELGNTTGRIHWIEDLYALE